MSFANYLRSGSGFRATPLPVFLRVFISVFILVVLTVTLLTFILPESFAGIARVRVERDRGDTRPAFKLEQSPSDSDLRCLQTELEVIRSEVILGKVISDLNLNQEWAARYGGLERLKTSESLEILKRNLDLRLVRNANIIEIRAFSEKPEEAAMIANAIAETYTTHARTNAAQAAASARVEIIDRAMRPSIPVRPNKPLNIALGVIAGTLLGLAAGAAIHRIAFPPGRNPVTKSAT